MTDRFYPRPAERLELTEQDLAIATLVGRYVERREHHATPCVHDLLAVAAEFGDAALDELRHRARLLRGDARERGRRPLKRGRTSRCPRTTGGLSCHLTPTRRR